MQTIFDTILSLIHDSGVTFTLLEHEQVRTSEDAAKARGVTTEQGVKSMVCKCDSTFRLFVLPGNRKIDWKKAKACVGSKEIRLATTEEAEEITQVEMGCVPPFGNLLNLPTLYDTSMHDKGIIYFNPGSRTHTISLQSVDLFHLADATFATFCKD